MKTFLACIMLSICIQSSTQSYRKIENLALNNGEKLSFRVSYHSAFTGNLTAGNGTLEVMPQETIVNNRTAVHVVAKGWTSGFIELFYKINDRLESYIDTETMVPLKFIKITRENKYKKDEIIHFNHKELIAESPKKKNKITTNTQDVLSIFYYARTLNVSNLKQGQYFQIPYFLDDSVYYSKIVYAGKEKISTKMGTFNCIKLKPMALIGNVFNQTYPITIWLTDDAYRIPILIESKLKIGEARIELTNSGTVNIQSPDLVKVTE